MKLRKVRNKLRLFFHPNQGRRELSDLLALARADLPLDERVNWLVALVRWIREDYDHSHSFDEKTGRLQAVRIRFLLHILERHPQWKSATAATLRSVIEETSALELFSHIGLAGENGLAAEAFARLRHEWLPKPPRDNSVADWFVRLFP